ncbi:hypothetical protein QTP88_025594 [Uroleucon formosanum]
MLIPRGSTNVDETRQAGKPNARKKYGLRNVPIADSELCPCVVCGSVLYVSSGGGKEYTIVSGAITVRSRLTLRRLAAPVIVPKRRDSRPGATSIQLLQGEPLSAHCQFAGAWLPPSRILDPRSSFLTPTGHNRQPVPASHDHRNIVYCAHNTNCSHTLPFVFRTTSRALPPTRRRVTEHSSKCNDGQCTCTRLAVQNLESLQVDTVVERLIHPVADKRLRKLSSSVIR